MRHVSLYIPVGQENGMETVDLLRSRPHAQGWGL